MADGVWRGFFGARGGMTGLWHNETAGAGKFRRAVLESTVR
jgi:hypothetical protein